MSLSINTNVSALTAHQNMLKNDTNMSQSLERMSTGLRINRAADDASGMAIADSLRAQHLGIGQAIQNANDGVSIVQTADGALEESINIVNTIKTKSIQAASDGETTETRSAIQADIDKLTEELDAIAKTTSYNGQQLLSGDFTNKQVQVGAYANETATINIESTESSKIGHVTTAKLELDNAEGGEVQLELTSAITGGQVKLESVDIQMNNSAENGMGALADEINSMSSQTGISAEAVVESQTSEAIQAGTTGTDFAINGITIGAVNVEDNDGNAALTNAINSKTNETGVTASMDPDGSLKLTSADGRAIKVTGDTGGILGTDTNEDMSTIGYVTLTQAGSNQISIEGTTSGGIGDAITLSNDLETVDDSELAAGSTIKKGSTLGAGSVVGGNATVTETVNDTRADYEMEAGSTLGAGSTISQGTEIGGAVVISGDTNAASPATQ
ncbi:MAG: flagellar protein FlaB, partial [Desulfobacterales bacterium]|nr:flagellar protein FlaB [Desulfobacterales bacterium]